MQPTDVISARTYSQEDLELIDAYWRAANYLSVGQIYLLDNPLLREPLRAEHVKPRLLGHWGTTPGLNLLYAHLNRVIKDRDLNALYVTGPGHGGPGLVANAYLEGTYSEVYSSIGQDEDGMRALFRQFSFPGGIPSHVAPETPGSIHEGGELGYALVHAYGAAFDNPDLLVAVRGRRRRGRDRAAGRQLALQQVPQPGDRRRRAAGAAPQRLQDRQPDRAGPHPRGRAGRADARLRLRSRTSSPATTRPTCTSSWPPPSTRSSTTSRPSSTTPATRRAGSAAGRLADDRAAHPEGLDRAEGGRRAAGRGHLPRPPGAAGRDPHQPRAPRAARGVDAQLPARGAVRRDRRLVPELQALAPAGDRRMSANPHANGGLLLRDLVHAGLPRLRGAGRRTRRPSSSEATRVLGAFLRDVIVRNPDRFRLMGPDETASNRLSARVRGRPTGPGTPRLLPGDDHLAAGRPGDGGAVRAPVPGLAGGLPAHRPARPVQLLRGVHPHRRLDVQPARQVAEDHPRTSRGGRRSRR